MTLAELRTLYWDWLDDPNGGYFTQSVANMRLNLAAKELQKALISANQQYYSKAVKTNLVNGQNAYALPSDFLQLTRLEFVNSGSGVTADTSAIESATPNQKDLFYQISGPPQFYTLEKNNLILQPVPDGTQELRLIYSYLIADMSLDADEPDAPEQFHEYIPILAARDGFIKDGRPLAPIESKMAEYKMVLKQIAEQRRADKPRMVVATDGGFGGY